MALNAVITAKQTGRRGCVEPGADGQAVGASLDGHCEVAGQREREADPHAVAFRSCVLEEAQRISTERRVFSCHSFVRSWLVFIQHMSMWVTI